VQPTLTELHTAIGGGGDSVSRECTGLRIPPAASIYKAHIGHDMISYYIYSIAHGTTIALKQSNDNITTLRQHNQCPPSRKVMRWLVSPYHRDCTAVVGRVEQMPWLAIFSTDVVASWQSFFILLSLACVFNRWWRAAECVVLFRLTLLPSRDRVRGTVFLMNYEHQTLGWTCSDANWRHFYVTCGCDCSAFATFSDLALYEIALIITIIIIIIIIGLIIILWRAISLFT